ncbi:MAG: hypothetical protein R2864_06810 [Syntrophotaleaceae bacterium]
MSRVGERMIRLAASSESRLIAVIMATRSPCFPAFISNIGATAVLMPVVTAVARKLNTSPSATDAPRLRLSAGWGLHPDRHSANILHEHPVTPVQR